MPRRRGRSAAVVASACKPEPIKAPGSADAEAVRGERLWGVLQDRLIPELRLAEASTRGQANNSEYRPAHNKRFAVPAQDTQPAWRQALTDHTKPLDPCAHHVRKVCKNHSPPHGRVIDIPRRADSRYATYAGKDVVVKHLLSGDYRVFHGEECIAWATGLRPKPSTTSNRNNDKEE